MLASSDTLFLSNCKAINKKHKKNFKTYRVRRGSFHAAFSTRRIHYHSANVMSPPSYTSHSTVCYTHSNRKSSSATATMITEWVRLYKSTEFQYPLWLVSFLLLALTNLGFMSFHRFQCCSNFIDPDTICWSSLTQADIL